MEDYLTRSDLTDEEKEALSNYQDIGNDQHVWSCVIPDDEDHHDCYVINKSLRDAEYRKTLSEEDKAVCKAIRDLLDSAIEKSSIPESVRLIKGLDNADWILGKEKGEIYTDYGYGSFSTSLLRSMEYANPQKDGRHVFIFYHAKKDTHGVYMGHAEEEVLLPRGMQYVIDGIFYRRPGELLPDAEAIVYYVLET